MFKVGDRVFFKYDYEQYGTVTEVKQTRTMGGDPIVVYGIRPDDADDGGRSFVEMSGQRVSAA